MVRTRGQSVPIVHVDSLRRDASAIRYGAMEPTSIWCIWVSCATNRVRSAEPHQMAHHVHLARSDKTFEIQDGETILEAANRAGIFIASNCRSGTCRTCVSRVVHGRVDHGAEY